MNHTCVAKAFQLVVDKPATFVAGNLFHGKGKHLQHFGQGTYQTAFVFTRDRSRFNSTALIAVTFNEKIKSPRAALPAWATKSILR